MKWLYYTEPVAKPLVLQLAGGAKLRRIRHRKRSKRLTEDRLVRRGTKAANAALELSPHLAGLIGFGATPYESTNCRKLAEDGENEDEYYVKPNSELKDQTANKVGVEVLRIRSASGGYQEGSGAALRRGFAITLYRLLWSVALLPWLFCIPLTAQQTHKKSSAELVELNFAVGVKTTLPLLWDILREMTHSNISRGLFVEGRLGEVEAFLRVRAELDDWGQNVYSEDHSYKSKVRRLRGTVGLVRQMASIGDNDIYAGFELGINHWDIDSDYPLFGKKKYNRVAMGCLLAYQAEHIFMELGGEIHSMDQKGARGSSWEYGNNPEQKRDPIGLAFSFAAGWKF